jgi:hypothetical protein
MPRIETIVCPSCDGSGADDVNDICSPCAGNGYVPAEPAIHDALQSLREAETIQAGDYAKVSMHMGSEGLVIDEVVKADPPEIDLTATTPTPGRMANQTWRILEEQRQAAEETIRECDAEIERWSNKLVDAVKTKGMCEAGQAALDGGL